MVLETKSEINDNVSTTSQTSLSPSKYSFIAREQELCPSPVLHDKISVFMFLYLISFIENVGIIIAHPFFAVNPYAF